MKYFHAFVGLLSCYGKINHFRNKTFRPKKLFRNISYEKFCQLRRKVFIGEKFRPILNAYEISRKRNNDLETN